jgi:hypothetical protein
MNAITRTATGKLSNVKRSMSKYFSFSQDVSWLDAIARSSFRDDQMIITSISWIYGSF